MDKLLTLAKPIAEGRTAEIYAWQEGWVLKLFHSWVSEESVQYEARINRAIYTAGLAVPKVGEIIEVDGRFGLIFEQIKGKTMFEVLASKPWLLIRLARELAVLHVEMHRLNAPPHIPSQSERLVHKVKAATDLGPALQEVVIHELESMPVGNQLCHGDFHPGNVMMGDKPTIIDWIDATSGNPLADVARTSILLMGIPQMTEKMPWLVKTLLNWYHRIYLKHYFHTRPQSLNEYRRWLPIIAAGRMDENITELNPWLRKQVEKGLDITPKAIQVILTH